MLISQASWCVGKGFLGSSVCVSFFKHDQYPLGWAPSHTPHCCPVCIVPESRSRTQGASEDTLFPEAGAQPGAWERPSSRCGSTFPCSRASGLERLSVALDNGPARPKWMPSSRIKRRDCCVAPSRCLALSGPLLPCLCREESVSSSGVSSLGL